jgi:osmoprotectant transport system ATP-binding protein
MTQASKAALALEGVSKRFGAALAVRGVSLVCQRGETVALLGGSGSGKSTVLRLCLGLLQPDAGTVYVAGERMDPERAPRLRRRMGYVIQDGGLFPHLTAEENVTLAARHFGKAPAWIADRVRELAVVVRLPQPLLARYPAELSGGERQRVALMRALALEPDALLLDEPFASLDPVVRAELQEEVRRIVQELGSAVLLVTHDVTEAAFLADRIVLLGDGAVLQEGTLKDFLQRPADPYVTRFVRAQRLSLEGAGR